jgi:hypothetical protein
VKRGKIIFFLKQRFNIDLKIRQCQGVMKDWGLANKRGVTGLAYLSSAILLNAWERTIYSTDKNGNV